MSVNSRESEVPTKPSLIPDAHVDWLINHITKEKNVMNRKMIRLSVDFSPVNCSSVVCNVTP